MYVGITLLWLSIGKMHLWRRSVCASVFNCAVNVDW